MRKAAPSTCSGCDGGNDSLSAGIHKDGVSCVALPEHTFFEICDSPGACLGLFAKMPIEKGQFMMSYDGERIDELEATHRYSHDPNSDTAGYLMRVTDDEYIDASDFAACKFGRVDQPGKRKNRDLFDTCFQNSWAFPYLCRDK